MTRLGRELACTRCAAIWDVIELPQEYIDPTLYVCPNCLRPAQYPEQLPLTRTQDERNYDPTISLIPF